MEPNLAELAAAVAAAIPDRECLVWRDRRRTWSETSERIHRLANLLRAHGLTLHRERGALDFEAALAGASPERPDVAYSPDDLCVLYTGGTTGNPKGVPWRQADIYFAALGGRKPDGTEVQSIDEAIARAGKGGLRYMPTAPFMHAAHWVAFDALLSGNTVVIQDDTRRLDAASILGTAEHEKVNVILIVGDAFARPLIDELKRRTYDLSALRVIGSGGAVLDPSSKDELLALLPDGVKIIDTVGSSETGTQASHASARGKGGSSGGSGRFRANPGARVLNAERTRLLEPGEDETGWFAQSGRIPLGYLGLGARAGGGRRGRVTQID